MEEEEKNDAADEDEDKDELELDEGEEGAFVRLCNDEVGDGEDKDEDDAFENVVDKGKVDSFLVSFAEFDTL